MQKQNLIVLTLLNLSILVVVTMTLLTQSYTVTPPKTDMIRSDSTPTPLVINEPIATIEPIESETSQPSEQVHYEIDTNNTLFIGDSRTIGLMEYGGNATIDYFADVGMSLYKMDDYILPINDIGKVSLEQLLSQHSYQTIFIMLGINDLGYNYQSLCTKFFELVTNIQQNQPEAKIILVKNLHLTASRSDSDPTFNNTNINNLNDYIATLANNDTIYCIDTNTYYDDQYGNLSSEYSNDNTHLYAKYYTQWLQQILDSASLAINQ